MLAELFLSPFYILFKNTAASQTYHLFVILLKKMLYILLLISHLLKAQIISLFRFILCKVSSTVDTIQLSIGKPMEYPMPFWPIFLCRVIVNVEIEIQRRRKENNGRKIKTKASNCRLITVTVFFCHAKTH